MSDFVPQDLRRLAHRWEAEDRAAETLAAAEREAIAEELAPHLPEGYSVAGGSAVAGFVGGVAFGNQPAPMPKNAARFHLQLHHATGIATPPRLRPIRAWIAHHLTVALCRASVNTRRFQQLILPPSGHDPLPPRSERVGTPRASHLSMGSVSPSGGRCPSWSPPPVWL